MFVVTWGFLIWLAAAVGFFTVAALIFVARPDRAQNRLLALALLLDGLNWTMLVVRVGAEAAEVATAALKTQILMMLASIFAYLAFLGTLDTPLTRPLRGHAGRTGLVLSGLGSLATVVLAPRLFYPTMLTSGPEPWRWVIPTPGPGVTATLAFYLVAVLFALAAALHAWTRTSPGSAARSRAGWYAAAFAARDSALLIDWGAQLLHHRAVQSPLHTGWGPVEMVLMPSSFLVFCALAAYGIFRHQLFDIDLKIQWTINRGTLVGAFLAVFFVVTVTAENFLTDRYGWAYGGVVAGLLLFALAPLQRFADRVANAAMPHVHDTEEYRKVRKKDVYLGAVEASGADGLVTERERDVLARLAEDLGLSPTQALALEREASGRMGQARTGGT